jgi:hypothetical protein
VSSGLSGNYAFGSRGDDANYLNAFYGTVGTVGAFTAAAGSITGSEDAMQDGILNSSISFPGTCYGSGSAGGVNGRVVITNGSGSPCSGNVTEVFWMVNPSRAFFLENSSNTFDDGTADLQSTSSFSNSTMKGQFALVMDGWDLNFTQLLARVGTLQFDGSSKLTVSELANGSSSAGGAQNPGILTGPYSTSPTGRITGNVSNPGGGFGVIMYAVSDSQAYVLQSDSGVITSGTVELQQ